MPKEAFLINPPRRRSRNPWFLHPKTGRKRYFTEKPPEWEGWVPTEYDEEVKKKRRKKVAKKKKKTKTKARKARKVTVRVGRRVRKTGVIKSVRINAPRRRRNPIGETLMVAGANPRRSRNRARRRNAPAIRYRRRNPVIALGGPMDFAKNMPYIFTGALSASATAILPPMILPAFGPALAGPGGRILGKFAIAIGGGFLVDMTMPRRGHGAVWALVGSGIALADALSEYFLKPMGFTVADYEISDYEVGEEELGREEELDAFPDTEVGMSAFPSTSYSF